MPQGPDKKTVSIARPPVVVVMGHIDHGKSTLLDYIRKTNVAGGEAGGITQAVAAYEVEHEKDGEKQRITFIDTPGHEAFAAMRSQGASVADIAILVVSAEDGVKPQTREALQAILAAKIPYVVAMNKIDKESADIERTKASLAESEVYIEGYGGDIPAVAISATTGQGIPELLDMVLLSAELQELKGDSKALAEGIVIEAVLDKRKGIIATLIIKNGTLKTGQAIAAGSAVSAGRSLENILGKKITEARFSSPVRVVGWSELPEVGIDFKAFDSKKEAEKAAEEFSQKKTATQTKNQSGAGTAAENQSAEKVLIPIVIKAGVGGGVEAMKHEIKKLETEKVGIQIIQEGVGDISESDVKSASSIGKGLVLGFNVKVDPTAGSLAERIGLPVQTFDVIYKLTEYLGGIMNERTPKIQAEETIGIAKVIRLFSKTRDRQVIGCRVESGKIKLGASIKIMRRETEIGRGILKELQQQKQRVSEVEEGREFGTLIESKTEIASGDRIECIEIVTK